jgi:hypothetical protein
VLPIDHAATVRNQPHISTFTGIERRKQRQQQQDRVHQ